MLNTVRAVVRRGKIELLEEIYIPDGTEVLVTVLEDHEDFHFEQVRPSKESAVRRVDKSIYTSFLNKFSESGGRVILHSIEESRRRHHNVLLLVHIFLAIKEVENELFTAGMQAVNANPEDVSEQLELELAKCQQNEGRKLQIVDTTRELFNRSLKRARKQGRQTIEAGDLFINLFAEPNGTPVEILRRLGADTTRLIDSV